ncbi:MAG: sugar kinase [Cytophagales bacterium]|nr:MAG: sugar kinase [Cytophagales bacterium]
MSNNIENIVIVRTKTKLQQIKEQFNTVSQAKFAIERQRSNIEVQENFLRKEVAKKIAENRAVRNAEVGSGDFQDFEREDEQYHQIFEKLYLIVTKYFPRPKIVEQNFLPSFIFTENDLVIVIGQDGLVANTAKYTKNCPIIGINPDPKRYDGVLLPFQIHTVERGIQQVLNQKHIYTLITMAEVQMNDGQRLLAFNDFFIGPTSHTSARYLITYNGQTETHSSSGLIVSTGAGATGWLSSLFNMANGIHQNFGNPHNCLKPVMNWDSNNLVFIVREPFLSRTSQINVSAGIITQDNELVVESLMANNGIIFSDGVEADKLRFNSGNIAKIGIAPEKAHLVRLN